MIYLKGFETFFENKKEVTCSYYDNLKQSPNRESFFKNLNTDKKKKVLQEAGNILGKCKKELIGWYKNPDTIKKFDDEDVSVIDKKIVEHDDEDLDYFKSLAEKE